jgi:hypothetical protein
MKERPPSSRPSPRGEGETGVVLAEDRLTAARMLLRKFLRRGKLNDAANVKALSWGRGWGEGGC